MAQPVNPTPALLTVGQLSRDELATITRLALRHDAEIPELELYDRYYEGTQPLSYMHPEILREVDGRIAPVVIYWPQLVVDSVEERLRLEGFKTGDEALDKELWRVWRASGMTVGLRQATVDALVMRRAYICVGTNEDDPQTPIVTSESPLEVIADVDPRTRKVRAALRRVWEVGEDGRTIEALATLYLPDETVYMSGFMGNGWRVTNRDRHNLGRVPVVPYVNRGRLRSTTFPRQSHARVIRVGRSDLDAIIPTANAANKLATDMVVAGEFLAVPLRALMGVGPDDFKDQDGNPQTPLQAIMGRLLTLPDTDAKAFEFAAAQLQNFTTALDALGKLAASESGLPANYFGQATDNPASAEALEAAEARLVQKAERKQDPFGCAVVEVAQLINRFQTGDWDKDIAAAAPDWRDPRTPTDAAMADATVKLYAGKVIPLRTARERLGYTEPEIEAMEIEDEEAAQRDPVAAIARGLAEPAPGQVPAAPGQPGYGASATG